MSTNSANPAFQTTSHAVILFDGECNVCSDSVRFILSRDSAGYFRFASLQSSVAKNMLAPHGLADMSISTMVLIEAGQVYTRSTAVVRVARKLGAFWSFLGRVLAVLPPGIRDALYSGFVKHRYALFGKTEQCLVPTPDIRERFLDLAAR